MDDDSNRALSAEQALALLESLPVSLVVLNEREHLCYANAAARARFCSATQGFDLTLALQGLQTHYAADGLSLLLPPGAAAPAQELSPHWRAVEFVPYAILLVDADGQIVLANEQAARTFGYRRDELLALNIDTLVPARMRAAHASLRAGYQGERTARLMGAGRELYALRRDGSEFPVEIGLSPIDEGGRALVLATIVDITPRRRAQEQIRRAVEFAPYAILLVSQEGRILLANEQAERTFGYRRETLLTLSVDDLVPQRYRSGHAALRSGYLGAPAARPMGAGRDLYALRADGSEIPVEIGLSPIEGETGNQVLVTVVDITARKRAQAQIEAALAEKTVLLNEVHHRVKNNLQVISSLLRMQASYASDATVQATLAECQARVRAMGLIHELLYERQDFTAVDFGEYLRRLGQLLQASYSGSSPVVSLRVEVPAQRLALDLHRAVPASLLVNELVTNAYKHAFPGGRQGEILIRLERCSPHVARLTVGDNGIGLPEGVKLGESRSLGFQLIPLFADQIGGQIALVSARGTCLQLDFALRDGGDHA